MLQYVSRRLVQALLALLGVSVIVFSLLHLTGDPSAVLLAADATEQERQELRQAMGLNDPLYLQYGRFFAGMLRGDFGRSVTQRLPAMELVLDRLPATAELAGAAMLLSLAVAIPAGVYSAVRRGSAGARLVTVFALLGQSLPVFWLGIMFILLFAVELRWFPTGGRGGLMKLVMPAVTLGMYTMARTTRMLRSSLLDVLQEDYMRTARAKGLAERVVIWRHALKNAMIPVITLIGLDMGSLLGGAVITETIFAWPGIGRLVVQSITARDFPIVQAAVFLLGLGYVVINTLVDVTYSWLDPRIRYS